jgi:predicted nucleotidyltransferase
MDATATTRYAEEMRNTVLANRAQVEKLAREYGVKNVRVFGSVANGSADANSDIDILVDDDGIRGYLKLGELNVRLSQLLGAKVDLLLSDSIKQNREDSILEGKQLWVC